ncbi:hypothetical protein CYMTET_29247 [Cymbomonas tetramitiformis]|uniref:EF-hand domain-containing protein n=1 Tax=Cymbomonas tetramitiformis TaxID=36881 RepID=A0AAE0FLM4_9CHLO|nr:hypothetical protein CYMTET_29247 [Cymbomonas tetramitiformis]
MLRKWFDSMDADGSGEISADELQDPLMSTGIARNRQEVEYVVSTVDDDGSGEIGFEEFLRLLKPKYGKGEEFVDNNAILRLKEVVSDSSSKEGALSITNTVSEQRRKLLLSTITTMYHVPKSNKKDCASSLRSPRSGEPERVKMEKKLLTLECLDDVVGRLVESAERDDNPFIILPQKSVKVTANEAVGRRSRIK